jgi:hypothetical protein
MGYRLDGWDLIPARGKIFVFSTASRPVLDPALPPVQRILGALSPGRKLTKL